MFTTIKTPVPTSFCKSPIDNTMSFTIDGNYELVPLTTKVQFSVQGVVENTTLDTINFLHFRGLMSVVRDTNGKVESIILGEMLKPEEKRFDGAETEDTGYGNIRNTSNSGPASNIPIISSSDLQISTVPPDYSRGHTYRSGNPSNTIYAININNVSYSSANEKTPKELPEKELLLSSIKENKRGGSFHPDIVSAIEANIHIFTDDIGTIVQEKLFGDFLDILPLETSMRVLQFLTSFYYGRSLNIITKFGIPAAKKLLSQYKVKDSYPYKEIAKAIEDQNEDQGIIHVIKTIRSIPPKDSIAFLSLLSIDPIIKTLREKIKEAYRFIHPVFRSTELKEESTELSKNIHWLELSNGCSVGCPFCSVEAPRKKPKELKHFPASDIILLATLYGREFKPVLYLGSDPLDWEGNIGGERLHYFDLHSMIVTLTGNIPYVSTAVPKQKVNLATEYESMIDDISLSMWNNARLKDFPFASIGDGLMYTERTITPSSEKHIAWDGISRERAGKNYTPLNVNAWFPSCSSGVKISPDTNHFINYITVGVRDAEMAPQGYFEVAITPGEPKYLSQALTFGNSKGDLSILQDLMKGAIALPIHTKEGIQRRTKQVFGEGSFLFRVLGFDGQERKYVFIYNYKDEETAAVDGKSAILYLTPQMYEEIYFQGVLQKVSQSDIFFEGSPTNAGHPYTTQEIMDTVAKKENLNGIIDFLYEYNNRERCQFTTDQLKVLIDVFLRQLNTSDQKQSWVIEQLIKEIMFYDEPYDKKKMLIFFGDKQRKVVLNKGLQIQLNAAIKKLGNDLKNEQGS